MEEGISKLDFETVDQLIQVHVSSHTHCQTGTPCSSRAGLRRRELEQPRRKLQGRRERDLKHLLEPLPRVPVAQVLRERAVRLHVDLLDLQAAAGGRDAREDEGRRRFSSSSSDSSWVIRSLCRSSLAVSSCTVVSNERTVPSNGSSLAISSFRVIC